MNVVNRVLIVVMLLFTMALCTLVLIAPVPVFEVIEQQAGMLVDVFDNQPPYVLLLMGIPFALLLDAILFLFIILELRRPSRKAIRVEKTAGGEVLISIASIADRIKHDVDQLADILRTKPRVSGKRSGVVIELDVEAEAGVNVPEKASQIVEVARRVVEEDMGLTLARPPRVNLRAAPYSKARRSPLSPRETVPAKPREALPVEPKEVSPVEPADWSLIEADEADEELPDLPEDLGENL